MKRKAELEELTPNKMVKILTTAEQIESILSKILNEKDFDLIELSNLFEEYITKHSIKNDIVNFVEGKFSTEALYSFIEQFNKFIEEYDNNLEILSHLYFLKGLFAEAAALITKNQDYYSIALVSFENASSLSHVGGKYKAAIYYLYRRKNMQDEGFSLIKECTLNNELFLANIHLIHCYIKNIGTKRDLDKSLLIITYFLKDFVSKNENTFLHEELTKEFLLYLDYTENLLLECKNDINEITTFSRNLLEIFKEYGDEKAIFSTGLYFINNQKYKEGLNLILIALDKTHKINSELFNVFF
ncbi:MAG: hypothetical protein J0H68_04320 [Sphingobacteriia bacterium]|nr:hypothetical protein [Sphingobacteriia bacterium]